MNKRENRRTAGRQLLFWGALSLLALTGYEFWARLDVLWWALKGVYNLCVAEGIPFRRALTYFDSSMFFMIAFLLACVVYALLALATRNRPTAGYVLIPCALAIGAVGGISFGIFGVNIFNWIASVKLLPLLAIVAGLIVNLVQHHLHRASERGRWSSMYEDEGIEQRGPRGKDVRTEVYKSRRDKRYRDVGLNG